MSSQKPTNSLATNAFHSPPQTLLYGETLLDGESNGQLLENQPTCNGGIVQSSTQCPFLSQQRNFRIGWIQGKRDPEREKKLLVWICYIFDVDLPTSEDFDLAEWLKDGEVLCRLMNKVRPGSVRKISTKNEFAQVENISNFLRAAQLYGLQKDDLFETIDLWEVRNIPKVTDCLFKLGSLASQHNSLPDPEHIEIN